jgi:hypothetical protein
MSLEIAIREGRAAKVAFSHKQRVSKKEKVASLCKNVTFPPPITHRLWKNATFASRISVVCAKPPPFLAGGRIPYAKTPPLRILGSSVIGRIAERLSLADSTGSTQASEDNIANTGPSAPTAPMAKEESHERPIGRSCRQPNHADVTEAALPRRYSERHCDDILFYQE